MIDGDNRYTSPAERTAITAVTLSIDGESMAYGCKNGSVKAFRYTHVKNQITSLGNHLAKVNQIQISEDGDVIASAGQDGLIKVCYHAL